MQNDANNQIDTYVQQRLAAGVDEPSIRNELTASGWSEQLVSESLRRIHPSTQYGSPPAYPTPQQTHQIAPAPASGKSSNRTRNGVLWIVSPFIVLIGVSMISFGLRIAGIDSVIINIITVLAGLVGVILFIAGPVIGIITLTRHD